MSVFPELRIGHGFDIHPFSDDPSRPLVLAGVRLDGSPGLIGHSDADAIAHAVTDALLGAAGLGDIGQHFPDTDPRWKGGNSLEFLGHACTLAADSGYAIVNVDSTVILERPRLKDFRFTIRESLARTMGIALDSVSVKFKTAETLGPVGEGRSAEAQAVVLLAKNA